MKVLVTGASGLLGRAVATAVLGAGHQVRTFQRRASGVMGVEDARGSVTEAADVRAALVGIDAVTRVVKVVGFVASAPGFHGQPGVVNGASELLGHAFGDRGVHARSAVGVAVLPLDAPVEVEITVALADD